MGKFKKTSTSASSGSTAPTLATVTAAAYGISKEFAADNPVRMPSPSDNALMVAARMRREIQMRSGRESTNLVGTQVYGNSYLGSYG